MKTLRPVIPVTQLPAESSDVQRRNWLTAILIPLGMLLLGLFLVFHRDLRGPGKWIPGGPGDTALVHYLLEHGYRWLQGAESTRGFWNAPFFYPHQNSIAYSEALLGLLPFYAIWRACGVGPGGAYQLWFVSLAILNFIVMYLFLRRVMALRALPAALGAYLFTFGASRVNQIGHSQLWGEFYAVLAAWFLIRFLQLKITAPLRKAVLWLSLAAAAVALQLISGFYLGWFLCFTLLIALFASLAPRSSRRASLERVRRFWPALPSALAVFLLIAGSSLVHYRAAANELQVHDFSARPLIMPTLGSWLYAGEYSLLYSWTKNFPKISRVSASWERANGIGILTGILVIAGAILWRRHPIVRVWLWVTAIMLVLTLSLSGDWALWRFVVAPIPGAAALRAVSRIGVFLLLSFAVGLACCLEYLYRRRGWAVVALLGAAVVLEQVVEVQHYDFPAFQAQAQAYAARLTPACTSFLITRPATHVIQVVLLHIVAMWTNIVSGVPTMNGYSGSVPPEYPAFSGLNNGRDYVLFRHVLELWEKHFMPAGSDTCWLRPDPGAGGAQGVPLSLELVSADAFSPRQKFIRWSYIGMLGRLPRQDELASAEMSLDDPNQNQVNWILELMDTPESRQRAFAEEAFLGVLGRDPDLQGWWHWSSLLANGSLTRTTMVQGLLSSEEYRQRCSVTKACRPPTDAPAFEREIESLESNRQHAHRTAGDLVFLDVLGRPAGDEASLFWAHQFDIGTPKSEYVKALISSQEYRNLVGAEP